MRINQETYLSVETPAAGKGKAVCPQPGSAACCTSEPTSTAGEEKQLGLPCQHLPEEGYIEEDVCSSGSSEFVVSKVFSLVFFKCQSLGRLTQVTAALCRGVTSRCLVFIHGASVIYLLFLSKALFLSSWLN